MPFYMKPDHQGHRNPALGAVFEAAIPRVAQILALFADSHPVVSSYNEYFRGKKLIDRNRNAGEWMETFRLVPTPELEAVISGPLDRLLKHKTLAPLDDPERQRRVMAVGSALLQLLAVQQELGESLNLNGDTMRDLRVEDIVRCRQDGAEALTVMFASIPLPAATSGEVATHMVRFNNAHTVYDPDLRPPIFRREFPSHTEPTKAIPVVVKRKNTDEDLDAERPKKRGKVDKPVEEGGGKTPAKKRTAQKGKAKKVETQNGRRLRSGKKV